MSNPSFHNIYRSTYLKFTENYSLILNYYCKFFLKLNIINYVEFVQKSFNFIYQIIGTQDSLPLQELHHWLHYPANF